MKGCYALFVAAALSYSGLGGTTIEPAHGHAYSANLGWISARCDGTNGAVIGQLYCEGYLWSANCGWIGIGNRPTNGWRYTNNFADWGVNHDGQGNLSGYAYGANVGWIFFEQTYGHPRVDLVSGNLSGYAYGANSGWISLSNKQAYVQTRTLDAGPDSNGNGIPDAWELKTVGSLSLLSSNGHFNGKSMTDMAEYVADTDPADTNDILKITTFSALAGTNPVIQWASKPTRLYTIERSVEMATATNWEDPGLGLQVPDPGGVTTRTVTDHPFTQYFYRVRADLPLAP